MEYQVRFGEEKKYFTASTIAMVEAVQEYCEKYKTWPKQVRKKNRTEQEVISHKLAVWLQAAKYGKEDFKYVDFVDDNGCSIKDRLDYLYNKYQHETIMVRRVEEYCEGYGEWPRGTRKEEMTEQEKVSKKLALWLQSARYGKEDFKYAGSVDENQMLLKDRLDYLYNKYQYETIMVRRVEEYCEKYGEWPKKVAKDKVTEQAKISRKLARWLQFVGYGKEDFKYAGSVDENQRLLKDRLDYLYNKYRHESIMVRRLGEYCEKYGEWPRLLKKEAMTEQGKTSVELLHWLQGAKYGREDFKYIHLTDENHIFLKDKLDELSAIYYGSRMVGKLEEYDKNYNLYLAAKSDNAIMKLYYLVVLLNDRYQNHDEIGFRDAYIELYQLIQDNDLEIFLGKIVELIRKNTSEKAKFCMEEYTNNSIQNNFDEAMLYKSLNNYYTVLAKGRNRMR